jgi:hypothetical protein
MVFKTGEAAVPNLGENFEVQPCGGLGLVLQYGSTLAGRRGRFARALPGAGSDSLPISMIGQRRLAQCKLAAGMHSQQKARHDERNREVLQQPKGLRLYLS